MMDYEVLFDRYQTILTKYLGKGDERDLYRGQQFSRKMIEQNVSPEEVVSLHIEVMNKLIPNANDEVKASMEFLLEVMIGYGFAYREHLSLRDKQQQLESEIEIAANLQQSLLEGVVPECDFIDIGVVSHPANQMNGDYFHFVKDEKDCVSVAIADIVGKGIPAAMCMSMIKYSMDSLPDQRMKPGIVLENLNRVVEQNVDSSMFITMFYGIFDPASDQFHFASAGHEPGFYYEAVNDRFVDLDAKGMVLGLNRETKYEKHVRGIKKGDMVVLLSDGVTECRTDKGFIEREEIADLIRTHMHLPAQKIVDNVFYELEKWQEFELRDDFTLLIMKY